MANISQQQKLGQLQTQHQKMSQKQIKALKYLELGNHDLRDVILKEIGENPALEIVNDPLEYTSKVETRNASDYESDRIQYLLENTEDKTETLQDHLMMQLNSMNLTYEELELSKKLIYNLDRNGFYGSTINPTTFLDKYRASHSQSFLQKCIQRIQKMDPVGTCCKNWEESLFVQAKIEGNATPLTLFILDGNINFLEISDPERIYNNIVKYQKDWHKKKFSGKMILDDITYTENDVIESIQYIRKLNPLPVQGYAFNSSVNYEQPDVILEVTRVEGGILHDDYNTGLICGNSKYHFQVKYASGILPDLRISTSYKVDKENYKKAVELISNLAFRESSIVFQGCAIVSAQKDFFLYGTENLRALTRREIARMIGVNESTVSRMSSKKGSKYIQTEWGLFPASYFFSIGIKDVKNDRKISSEVVKSQIQKIIEEYKGNELSDSKITELLNDKGIKIARRTVSKYRIQLGINNSYRRKYR